MLTLTIIGRNHPEGLRRMVLLDRSEDGVDIRLSVLELSMLSNALNEVCHGIHFDDWDFQTRLGWDRAMFRELLDRIQDLGRGLDPHAGDGTT